MTPLNAPLLFFSAFLPLIAMRAEEDTIPFSLSLIHI